MPITKYRCLDCGKEFSKIYFSLENAPTKCTVCGASNIVEAGPTFRDDSELAERILCMSCDSCSDDDCGSVRSST